MNEQQTKTEEAGWWMEPGGGGRREKECERKRGEPLETQQEDF